MNNKETLQDVAVNVQSNNRLPQNNVHFDLKDSQIDDIQYMSWFT